MGVGIDKPKLHFCHGWIYCERSFSSHRAPERGWNRMGESPYVVAMDREKRKLVPLAHRECVVMPRFTVLRSLASDFDFQDRDCGICLQRLMGPENLPVLQLPQRPAEERIEPAAPPPSPSIPPRGQDAPAQTDIVWASVLSGSKRTRIVAHRSCVRNPLFPISFAWQESRVLYRGQPHCDVCGKLFLRKPGAL